MDDGPTNRWTTGRGRMFLRRELIPVVLGGANTARNLQLLCDPCNLAKGGNLT